MKRFSTSGFLTVAAFVIATAAFAAEPIATAFTNWGEVSVELMSVERKGNVLTVKWAVRNEGESRQAVFFGFAGEDVCYAVDEESGTKYYVLTDKEGVPLASANDWISSGTSGSKYDLDPGQVKRHWMKLPAPPPEVTAISIFMHEVEPFEGVPITDK